MPCWRGGTGSRGMEKQKRKRKRWGKKYEDKRDWKAYNKELVKRGEFYINPRFLDTWLKETREANAGKEGRPFLYPESLIEFLAILHEKSFDYRALQGIMSALSKRLGPFPVITFSQIRRRVLQLDPEFQAKGNNLVVGVDGSGLKVSNRGEWIRQKWKVRRGWVKVVILGDTEGNIVDIRVGNENLDERAAGRGMLRKNRKNIDKYLGDGLHDCNDSFDLCDDLNIEAGIKIRENANPSGLGPRPRAVREYQKKGYKQWAEDKGYGLRWPATEGIFSAVKGMFGETLTAHKKRNLYHQAKLKFWAYQRVRDFASPM